MALEWVLLILFKIKYTHGTTFWVVLDQDIDWVFRETHLPRTANTLTSWSYIHLNIPTTTPTKKDSLWLIGPNVITSLAAIVYRGLFHTLHPRKKQQTDLPSLLHCVPAV